jgi:hypothetical protein
VQQLPANHLVGLQDAYHKTYLGNGCSFLGSGRYSSPMFHRCGKVPSKRSQRE